MPRGRSKAKPKRDYRAVQAKLAETCRPESLVMSYGYEPSRSEGALVPPIFLASTFVFPTAEEGKRFFELAYNLRPKRHGEELGLIYSRVNNPNLQIVEERLTLLEKGAEAGALFASGMAAITTSVLALVSPGECVVSTEPVYGGTDYLFRHILPKFGIKVVFVPAGISPSELTQVLHRCAREGTRPAAIFVETPANPTNVMTDIAGCAEAAKSQGPRGNRPLVLVDNTFMGPLWQRPLEHGADLVLYSGTKFLGGHSDLVAGAVLGHHELVDQVLVYRTILGTMGNPFDGYLMLRSLDTLTLRMGQQTRNAQKVAAWLARQPQVARVHYPGLSRDRRQREILRRQCLEPGSMVSFEVRGGESDAFRFLNSLHLVKMAVSLGGTKTLAEHPGTMTHSDVPRDEREEHGITDAMVRLSVGVENVDDLIADLDQALGQVRPRARRRH